MWTVLDFVFSLLMLFGVGGGLVWAAYALPRGLLAQYVSAAVLVIGCVTLWVSLENRGRASRTNRRCPACGERLRLERKRAAIVGPSTAECRWCGSSFVWRAAPSRFGIGRWEMVSGPKRPRL